MSRVIERAKQDLERAEDRILRAVREKNEILSFIKRYELYDDESFSITESEKTLAQEIELILSGANGPMLSSEIVERLKAAGREINSSNPTGIVSTTLSRSKKFAFEKGKGWTFNPYASE